MNIAKRITTIPTSKPKILLRDLCFLFASTAAGVNSLNSFSFFSLNIINT